MARASPRMISWTFLNNWKTFFSWSLKDGYKVVKRPWVIQSCRIGWLQWRLCRCLRRFKQRSRSQTHATSSTSISALNAIYENKTKQKIWINAAFTPRCKRFVCTEWRLDRHVATALCEQALTSKTTKIYKNLIAKALHWHFTQDNMLHRHVLTVWNKSQSTNQDIWFHSQTHITSTL